MTELLPPTFSARLTIEQCCHWLISRANLYFTKRNIGRLAGLIWALVTAICNILAVASKSGFQKVKAFSFAVQTGKLE